MLDNFVYQVPNLGGRGLHVTSPKFELRIGQEGRVYKISDSVYKIVQNEYKIMIQFFMLKLHLGAACHQQPKFELLIRQEGMVYKIWDAVYKIVQKKYKIMIYFSFLKFVLGRRWYAPCGSGERMGTEGAKGS